MLGPKVEMTRWAGPNQPSEDDISRRMQHEGLRPFRVATHIDFDRFPQPRPFDMAIWVVDGELTLSFTHDGSRLTLEPGDRINIPAGIVFELIPDEVRGVAYFEANVELE